MARKKLAKPKKSTLQRQLTTLRSTNARLRAQVERLIGEADKLEAELRTAATTNDRLRRGMGMVSEIDPAAVQRILAEDLRPLALETKP